MIRRKKTDDDIELTPLTDDNYDIDGDDWDEDDSSDQEEKPEKKKKGFSIGLPWKKKSGQKAEAEEDSEGEADTDSSEEDVIEDEESEENRDILGLGDDGEEYLELEDEKKFSVKKILLIVAAVAIVLGVGITLLVKNLDSGDSGKVYVESVRVLAGLGSGNGGTNRYTGIVEAQESWKITLDADMSVAKCYVKVGDEVKKGDKLFTYNTEELKLNQEKKELEVDTLTNESNQLEKDIATYEKDLKSASSSEKIELQTQILTARTTIKKNEFTIKSGKEEIEKIKKNIADATVTSKMDGVIKNINKALGEGNSNDDTAVNTDMNTDDASVYMTVLSVGDYRVKGKISETNAASIEEGQRMIVRSRVDDQTWTGLIERVKTDSTSDDSSSGSNNSDYYDEGSATETASSYNFYVELDSVDGLLMGQHVFLEVDNGQDEERDGIWLSSAYILIEDDNYYAWVDNKGKLEKRAIEVGEYDEVLDEYQILSGIGEDDYIACDDIDLKAGMKTTQVDPYAESAEGEEGMESGEDAMDNETHDEFEEGFDDGSMDGESVDGDLMDEFEDEGAYTESDDMQGDVVYEEE